MRQEPIPRVQRRFASTLALVVATAGSVFAVSHIAIAAGKVQPEGIRHGGETFRTAQAACNAYVKDFGRGGSGGAPKYEGDGDIRCFFKDGDDAKDQISATVICPLGSTASGIDSCTCDGSLVAKGNTCVEPDSADDRAAISATSGTSTESGSKTSKADCEEIEHQLQASGALRETAREIHDLAPMFPSDIKSPQKLASPRSRTSQTIALAEIERADKCHEVIGSASGNSLRPPQRTAMEQYRITIAQGSGHAEMNIRDALPPNSRVIRWGISWAGQQRSEPCNQCESEVKRLGGTVE